jgi:hypothetical protein
MPLIKKIGLVTFGFFLAIASINLVKIIRAASDGMINACVDKKGNIQIVSGPADCKNKETFLSWRVGDTVPTPPPSGDSTGLGGFLQDMSNTDLEGVQLYYHNLSGYNFSGSVLQATNFTGSNLTGANLSNTNINYVFLNKANLTNADLKGATFEPSKPPKVTDVVWSNTTCPDSTNSNNNGNTCVGHLGNGL